MWAVHQKEASRYVGCSDEYLWMWLTRLSRYWFDEHPEVAAEYATGGPSSNLNAYRFSGLTRIMNPLLNHATYRSRPFVKVIWAKGKRSCFESGTSFGVFSSR